MTLEQEDARVRIRREQSKLAIDLAMQSRWQDACEANQRILDLFPEDVEAWNRLGKALGEMGLYARAKDAFQKALKIAPHNPISRKNLRRLSSVTETPAKGQAESRKVVPQLFITEMGRTGTTSLVDLARGEVLAKVSAGDPAELRVQDTILRVETPEGEYLGQIEPRLSLRLVKLMQGGNKYAAAIASVEEKQVKVIIKETYQDPSQAGRVSFPVKAVEEVRSYIRESLLRRGLEEEEDILREYLEEQYEGEPEALPPERSAAEEKEPILEEEEADTSPRRGQRGREEPEDQEEPL